VSLIRVLPNEVHVFLTPGRPAVVTRSVAIELHRELTTALKLPEPFFPRLPWYRRLIDWWRYRPTAKRLAEDAARRATVERLMGSGKPTTLNFGGKP